MHYSTIETYLREADTGPGAGLPLPVVARWLGVTPPAVKAMLARGELPSIGIGSLTLVSVSGLRQWLIGFETEVKRTRKILTKAARKGKALSYGDLLAKLDRDYQRPADRRRLRRLIEAASAQSLLEDGLLLGVWAYARATDLPKYGVWELAEEKGLYVHGSDQAAFVKSQREAAALVLAKTD